MDLKILWNKTICIAGARNQGKTNLAQYLTLAHLAPLCDLIILFGNGGSVTQWDFLQGPKLPHRVYPEVKEEVILECFRENGERLRKKQAPIRYLVIFDDSLSRTTVYGDAINKIFIHGRIFNICPLILQQSVSQIHPDWRRNADYWFVAKPRTQADYQWIYENLTVDTENKKEAFAMIRSIPKFTFLFVDFTQGDTSVQMYKAPLVRLKN